MHRLGLNHQITAALALVAGASTGTAAPPTVESRATSPVSIISREELERLPTSRRVEDLIRTCPSQSLPTVSRRPGILADGAPTSQAPSIDCIRPDDLRMIDVFKAHNAERALYGYQPMVWNPVLARNAQAHANRLSQIGRLEHASREGRGTERESISQGLRGWNVDQVMSNWFRERQHFKPGIFPNVSTTGNWSDVGHYTAIIWVETTDIGCGMSETRVHVWLVCRYNPGGNKDGKPVGFPMQPQQVASSAGGAGAGTDAIDTAPLFVNDRWRLNDYWSFNAGTRYEESAPPPSAGQAGQRASLFDLGLYGGGAWTSDWFADDPGLSTQASGESCAPGLDDLSYFDLSLSFRVGDRYNFRMGANSLLDRDPPLLGGSESAGGPNSWSNVYDALGRYIYAGCALNF